MACQLFRIFLFLIILILLCEVEFQAACRTVLLKLLIAFPISAKLRKGHLIFKLAQIVVLKWVQTIGMQTAQRV